MNKKCFIQTLKMFTYDTQEKKLSKEIIEKWNGGELCDHSEIIDFFSYNWFIVNG